MRKLLRVSDRHQITLPPDVMKDVGLREGSYVEVSAEDGKILLRPKAVEHEELSREDWDKLDRLVLRQVKTGDYSEYPDPAAAKKHLK